MNQSNQVPSTPTPPPANRLQEQEIVERGKLLGVFHYVLAGMALICSLFPAIYLAMGILFSRLPMEEQRAYRTPADPEAEFAEFSSDGSEIPSPVLAQEPSLSPPSSSAEEAAMAQGMVSGMFIVIGLVGILLLVSIALFIFLAGKRLSRQQSYQFCFVMACISCLWMPIGTVLGIFTILYLLKPEVKQYFQTNVTRATSR